MAITQITGTEVWHGPWRWLAAMRGQPSGSRADKSPHATQLRDSDVASFEVFFRRNEPQLTGYLWRMTGDAESARDLCQETFVRAWQHFTEVSQYDQPKAWLFRVATNLALNYKRRQESLSLEEYDAASSDPSIRLIERDLVRQTLLELPAKQRAMLIFREVYNLTYVDIGAYLNMSPDAVKMALSRAREQFRQRYRRKDQS